MDKLNINRENIKETLRNIMAEESEYQTFFKKALEKAGKSIPSMSDEEKKEFFNKIDAAWNAKGEKNEGNAFGAAVTAAKEKGDDEFEVGGKTYKVEESNDCGCNSVNEGVSSADMEKIKSAVEAASSFMNVGSELKKTGMKYMFATSPMPIYVIQDKSGNRVAVVNKKYATKPDFVHKDIAVGVLESVVGESINEGRAFVQAARKAKEEGKTEFEFNGKTYPVTLKESLNEDANMNKKVKQLLDKNLKELTKGKPNHQFAVMHILMGALSDANFHSEAKQVAKLFPKAKYEGDPMAAKDVEEYYHYELGPAVANICKWDGKDIVMAMGFYISMTIGRPLGQKVETLVESLNEARLGKVSLLKSVENGDTSYVEGVKISPELAFELRMFLQRPLMARTRTGIAIDNSQMKDAIGMLAKVGVHKRLSSGVKGEFANLLKKYSK